VYAQICTQQIICLRISARTEELTKSAAPWMATSRLHTGRAKSQVFTTHTQATLRLGFIGLRKGGMIEQKRLFIAYKTCYTMHCAARVC